jgi:signal transduction histidine kinase
VDIKVVVSEDLGELDEVTNMTLYRLVQEGLTNIARHARASRVEILMHQRPADSAGESEVVLTISDNGVGSQKLPPHAGLGLVGMRERIEALAGRFDVASAQGGGFGFTARIPVHQGRMP